MGSGPTRRLAAAATSALSGRSGSRWRSASSGRSGGLSQRELAERLGTTQSAVARIGAGNVSPSLPTLDKIAEALEVELVVSFVDLDDRMAG
ncbi:MAG TPA: helix-turn-helix transcriptional regulator [Acidimicrobiales bacterium]|nr:helix-turn-helix transcriptional regulator [Acidimicrobiales bacterium]